MKIAFIFCLALMAEAAGAHDLRLELGSASTNYNYFQIPQDTGSRVDLPKGGSLFYYRISGNYIFNNHHSLKALYAPFLADYDIVPATGINFEGTAFPAATATTVSYKFNSYRVGYIYTFNPDSNYVFKIGAIGKIRDAFIRVKNANLSVIKANIGFVPLINLGANLKISEAFRFVVDIDGLAAPQGRAVDGSLEVLWQASDKMNLSAGTRLLEGGSSIREVDNFGFFSFYFVAASLQL